MWSVYILSCADGTYYTGIAKDLEARLRAHNAGKGAKYTRARLPVAVIWSEKHVDRSSASKREAAIKRLSRAGKEHLVAGGNNEKQN